MWFEFNFSVARTSAEELLTIENKLRYQAEKLNEIMFEFKRSEDNADLILARKIQSRINEIEREIRNISLCRKSLEKIISVYENNEKNLAQQTENVPVKFRRIPSAPPLRPIPIVKVFNSDLIIKL